MKYSYMLSDSYCQNWVIQDAIREIIANAMSTHDEVELDWHNGIGYVCNSKRRLEVRHLLIGESDNREDKDAIGTFGEGLKIAGLVFCRNNRRYTAKTNKHIFEFSLEFIPEFERNVLAVEVKPTDNKEINGTLVEFDCTDDEFYFAKGLFRELSPVEVYEETRHGAILKEIGKVYVLGVLIGEQDLLFGYDLKDKTLINRDRTIVDATRIHDAIEKILETTTNAEVINDLIEASIRRDRVAETQLYLTPDWGKPRDAWKKVIDGMGKIATTCGNAEIDARAGYLGFQVVDAGHLNSTLRWCGDVKDAKQIQPEPAKHFITIDKLTKSEKSILNRAIKFYKDVAKGPSCEVRISEDLDNLDAQQKDKKVTLNRKILDDFPKTFRALCHEGAHIMSGAGDCSADFETALGKIIENIAKTRLASKKSKSEEISV